MSTLTGVAGTLPLPGIATTAAPGTGVTTADQNVTAQQLLNQDATLGAHIDGTAFTDIVKMNGRKALDRSRVLLVDGSLPSVVKVSDGDTFELDPAPASGRVLKLGNTTPTPAEAEKIRFICPGLTNANTYQFQREDATLIASFYGTALGNTCVTAEFERVSGVWRLGMNSGWNQTETQGVLAGPGA